MYPQNLENFKVANFTNESYYWLGFLLADGHFRTTPSGITQLSVELSEIDLEHLQKLLVFLGRPITSFTQRIRKLAKYNKEYSQVSFRITSPVLTELVNVFGLSANKTVQPPSSECFKTKPMEAQLSLLIGYIDGDGYIRGRLGHRDGKLECHKTWSPMYDYFSSLLSHKPISFLKTKDACVLYLSSDEVKFLYEVGTRLNLPILYRKWASVKASLEYTKQPSTSLLARIKDVTELKDKYTQKEISVLLNISIDQVKYCFKKINSGHPDDL